MSSATSIVTRLPAPIECFRVTRDDLCRRGFEIDHLKHFTHAHGSSPFPPLKRGARSNTAHMALGVRKHEIHLDDLTRLRARSTDEFRCRIPVVTVVVELRAIP